MKFILGVAMLVLLAYNDGALFVAVHGALLRMFGA
jgi:hypothetical protein